MNTLDVFAGLSWGSLDRYKIFHDQIVRKERAAELDGRILDLIAKPQNVAWARSAVDFCARETGANRDVFDLSKEAYRLTEIRDKARAILDAEGVRLAGEKKQSAANADATILTLSKAPRNQYWCQEVLQLEREVQDLSRDARMMMKQLSLLQQLVKETGPLLEAVAIDDEIRTLNKDNRRDKNWLSAVEALKNKITASIKPLMQELSAYEELQKKYWQVVRYPIYSEYNICLDQIESGKWEQKPIRDKFLTLHENLNKHGFSMSEHIRDFQDRWASAKEKVDAKNRSLAAAELARKNAAIHEAQQQKAKPYEDCLLQIESGQFDAQVLYGTFNQLDVAIKRLDFDLSNYVDKFQSRWSAARKTLVNERNRIAEEARLARLANERLAREQEERDRQAQWALDKKRKRNERLLSGFVFLWVPFILAMMFFAFLLAAKQEFQWYAPFVSAAAMIAVWFFAFQAGSMKILVVSMLLVGVNAIVSGVYHQFSTFAVICSVVAAGATAFLCASTVMYETDKPIKRAVSPCITIALVIGVVELFVPSMLEKSFWHACWIVPITAAIIAFLSIHTFKGKNDAEPAVQFGLTFGYGAVFALLALVRTILLSRAILEAGAGKILVLIAVSTIMFFVSYFYCDEHICK